MSVRNEALSEMITLPVLNGSYLIISIKRKKFTWRIPISTSSPIHMPSSIPPCKPEFQLSSSSFMILRFLEWTKGAFSRFQRYCRTGPSSYSVWIRKSAVWKMNGGGARILTSEEPSNWESSKIYSVVLKRNRAGPKFCGGQRQNRFYFVILFFLFVLINS